VICCIVCSTECSQIVKRMTEVRDAHCKKRRGQLVWRSRGCGQVLQLCTSRPRGKAGGQRGRYELVLVRDEGLTVEWLGGRLLARKVELAVRVAAHGQRRLAIRRSLSRQTREQFEHPGQSQRALYIHSWRPGGAASQKRSSRSSLSLSPAWSQTLIRPAG
jgi:hypothetical protein